MQINTNNPFISWDLTPEETALGHYLSDHQKAVIQNDIADAAMQKVHLKYDLQNPQDFVQKEAELQGRILILQYLLARAETPASVLDQS